VEPPTPRLRTETPRIPRGTARAPPQYEAAAWCGRDDIPWLKSVGRLPRPQSPGMPSAVGQTQQAVGTASGPSNTVAQSQDAICPNAPTDFSVVNASPANTVGMRADEKRRGASLLGMTETFERDSDGRVAPVARRPVLMCDWAGRLRCCIDCGTGTARWWRTQRGCLLDRWLYLAGSRPTTVAGGGGKWSRTGPLWRHGQPFNEIASKP